MKVKLDDIPDTSGERFPERLNVAITSKTYKGLEHLKKIGKDRPEFIRFVLDKALQEVLGAEWENIGKAG